MISWFEKHNKISLIIVILIAILIFYLSSLTFAGGAPGPKLKYKSIIYHFFIFFLFSFFLLIALLKGEKTNLFSLFSLAILLSIIYAVSDEFHQFFVSGRACALSDILTDSAGILFAGLLYSFRIRLKNN